MQLKLKELRLSKGLTQAQVADAINISAANYSRYESNINEPPLIVICKLADYFNCSVDYLLNRTEYMESASNMINSVNSVLTSANKKIELLEAKITELDYLSKQAMNQLYHTIDNKTKEVDHIVYQCQDKIKQLEKLQDLQEYQSSNFEQILNEAQVKLEHLKSIIKF